MALGQLYGARCVRAMPDDKARAAAEEAANYDDELSKLRTELSVRIVRVEADVRLAQASCSPFRFQLLFGAALREVLLTDAIGPRDHPEPGEPVHVHRDEPLPGETRRGTRLRGGLAEP